MVVGALNDFFPRGCRASSTKTTNPSWTEILGHWPEREVTKALLREHTEEVATVGTAPDGAILDNAEFPPRHDGRR